jgi:hypothetical protein
MWYFFYGTLKDPSRLASIAGLEELPNLIYAKVHHVGLRYWGEYPVLVPDKTGAVIEGMAWFAPSVEVINRLRAYETDAYYDEFVKMEFRNLLFERLSILPKEKSLRCEVQNSPRHLTRLASGSLMSGRSFRQIARRQVSLEP